MDFFVDFSGHFAWKNKQEKVHWKIHQKHDFQGNFLTKIHSGRFLPWALRKIEINAVKLKLVQDLGFYKLKTGPSYKLKTGPSFFCCFSQFYTVFWAFLETQIVSQCVKIVFFPKFWVIKMRFSKRKLHFCFFYVGEIETKKKKKMEKTKKPYKNRFFLRWSSKNVKNQKKWIFSKNCLTVFVSGREKKRAFSLQLSVLAKISFGPKQCKAGNTIKIGVSAEIAKKQKWHLFFEKGVFWHGWKKWVLLTVFLKSCVFLKTLFV